MEHLADIQIPEDWVEGHGALEAVDIAGQILVEDDEYASSAYRAIFGTAIFVDHYALLFLAYEEGVALALCGPEKGIEERFVGRVTNCPSVRKVWADMIGMWISDLRAEW